jgi:hypothetical protein
MSIARLAHLRVARFFIKTMRPFSHCEDASYREQASPDWVACARDTMRGTIGECFLVAAQQVKLAINSAAKRAVLAFVHLNADLWTSKVSHQKFLGVRIFWKSGPELKTALLAVTSYAPPKVADKAASEWLLEYVLAVLKWYGVEPSHVKGATSDAGSDCKKAFHKLAQEHGWMWLWCFPHAMHCALVECLGTQLDRRKTSNPEARQLIDKVRRVCGKLASSPPSGEAFKNLQHIWVATQRHAVQEADLVGHTAAKMRSMESGPRAKRLSTDVSQRWASSILMIMHVLVNWGVLQALYIQKGEDFSLEDDEKALVQLFSILFRVHIFLRISQATHLCSGVSILLELRYLLHTTLNCGADLQIFDPRKAAARNLDIYNESSYTKEDKKVGQLVPMVQAVRQSLRKAVVKRFLHASGYACKNRGGVRCYMLDMYMYLCPISFNFMQNPRQSHVDVFLDEGDKLPGMHYYTPTEVHAGTQTEIKSLMRKILRERKNTPALEEEHSSSFSDEPSSGKKRKRHQQTTLNFGDSRYI